MHQPPQTQVPPVYHRRIGDIIVTCVSDGYLDAGITSLQNIEPEEARQILAANFRPARRASVNCFLVHSAGRLALIDTGCGTYLQPSAGQLLNSLHALGVDPAAIDTVLLTHVHPDHSAGLSDRRSGARYFPNAELVVHHAELEHWFDDVEMYRMDEQDRKHFFHCAREQIEPYASVIKTFRGEADIFPGVTSVPLPGHTPGHSGFMIASGGDGLLILGDIIHVPEIQVTRPEVTMSFDHHPALAASTRRDIFADVARDRLLVAGMHIDFPGFAHIIEEGDSFRLLPEPWQYQL
ncbi:MBL fold metallo-hydrolase [Biostraticola tofi]|uniref:Glyoxylase-like metal-dependent hydrolase (Beta-lactamase superfamily II) n=1 Tax=Biostraticola tofi TaxID=466109 RepID=A0A4R3Z5Q6_9GAMM|nr:MBL fold metallo-hydrolase [Biostraticola tofi]TCV99248.1 glyoxylase-like metal-dependent hydrolase (beta-lactamase superfamily II) [Biostraticola tofi]